MSVEFDYDLTSHQWEALKALRAGAPAALLNRSVEDLIALSLATMSGNRLIITSTGRKVLVRGSPRLWDVAA
jgi:hypothetical protein